MSRVASANRERSKGEGDKEEMEKGLVADFKVGGRHGKEVRK
jgi:hypothetical protein